LGADALNPVAIQKVYKAKRRPATNPLIIHLPHREAMRDWAIRIPENAWTLAKAFWPGPLTLILAKHPRVPLCATGNQQSVGLRVPKHPVALALLEAFGGGVAAPSANRYGRISPTTSAHVREELGDKIDFILEGGPCEVGIESTIVSLLDETPVILREGHISEQMLAKALGLARLPHVRHNIHSTLEVPGQHHSHYAPSKPLYLLSRDQFEAIEDKHIMFNGMGFSEPNPAFKPYLKHWIQASLDPAIYAQELYAHLRTLDSSPGEFILVETPPKGAAWLAIYDRLLRASKPLD
jgi:L-threonylcarbamoyladenylate synthase